MAWHKQSAVFDERSAARYISIGDVAALKVPEKTIITWTRVIDDAGQMDIINAVSTNNYYWRVDYVAGQYRLQFTYIDSLGGVVNVLSPYGMFDLSRWTMLAVSQYVDDSDNVLTRMYKDSRLVYQESNANGINAAYGNDFRLYWQYAGAGAGLVFYDRALSQSDIRNIWSYKVRPQDVSGCVSFWPMTDVSFAHTTTISDIVGGHDGTMIGHAILSNNLPIRERVLI